jgi:DNA gyrase subunit A
VTTVALHETTQQKYLNYALSVITSRALPDVRDGLKPVQRRILYAMAFNLGLYNEGRYRKSAAVVGEVMAKYHPHGDSSIYDAMVRMAQPFSLRHPLVDGQGNFGSMDGDSAAAMRYTESKLAKIARLLLDDTEETVPFGPSYDGQNDEPEVLPVQFPQLLINGSEGIAVGMATRIPPHNLREVVDATVALIDDPSKSSEDLLAYVRGPDFPTGGILQDDPAEIRRVYTEGSGSLQVRSKWTTESRGRKHNLVVTEIPYAINKATLVEKIGEIIADKRLPQVVDIRDESTERVRIVMELREAGDAEAAMAYLFKHTDLQSPFHVNLTCLFPVEGASHLMPQKADLAAILRAWLEFRFDVVTRKFQAELSGLRDRTHVLVALETAFANAPEVLKIIQAAEDKAGARAGLVARFQFDDVQVDRVLDLQVHQLSRAPIDKVREELATKRKREADIEFILSDVPRVWETIRKDLITVRDTYGEVRRTTIAAPVKIEYDKAAYVLAEDTYVLLTRDGLIKRAQSFASADKVRVRDGDELRWVLRGNTRQTVTVYTSAGTAYGIRADQILATSGYGEPIQKNFAWADGEKIVGITMVEPTVGDDDLAPHGVAVLSNGRVLRFPLATHASPSTKSGRKFAKLDPGDTLLTVFGAESETWINLITDGGRGLSFQAKGVPATKAPGKGVIGVNDTITWAEPSNSASLGLRVETTTGPVRVCADAFGGHRAAKGKPFGKFVSYVAQIGPRKE